MLRQPLQSSPISTFGTRLAEASFQVRVLNPYVAPAKISSRLSAFSTAFVSTLAKAATTRVARQLISHSGKVRTRHGFASSTRKECHRRRLPPGPGAACFRVPGPRGIRRRESGWRKTEHPTTEGSGSPRGCKGHGYAVQRTCGLAVYNELPEFQRAT